MHVSISYPHSDLAVDISLYKDFLWFFTYSWYACLNPIIVCNFVGFRQCSEENKKHINQELGKMSYLYHSPGGIS